MKYEFHVGDYVETKGGAKGYISDSNTLWWECTYEVDGYSKGFQYSIDDTENNNIKKYFNRIGQYDFTKKDKDKIEPLPENYTEPYIIHATSLEEYRIINIGDISKKINELVEAVNRLKDKT